jgi:hypothetical protein
VKNTDGDSEFPELEYPELTGELREFGAYLHAEPVEAMPTHVWEQIATTISLESADRVVPDSPAALGCDPAVLELESYRKRRIGGKWVGGLVAASVTLFAVGIGVNVLNSDSGDQNSVVADAPLPEDQVADSGSLGVASPQIIQAGFVPPSVEIMESGNEYNSSNLRESINQILRKIGVEKPMDMFMAPVQNLEAKKMSKATGMTGSLESLRKCVTEITNSESSQALLVDRATYQGMDAGVIVIPMAMFTGMDAATTNDERVQLALDLESLGTDLGALDIWVVGPDCGNLALDVYSHVTHSLK